MQLQQVLIFGLAISLLCGVVHGTAERPPMGWNSWDSFLGSPTEDQFYGIAESFQKVLAPHGYEYLVIDAGWYYIDTNGSLVANDGYSRLVPSPTLWPSTMGNAGFKPISNLAHSMGLKFGFHVMRGIHKSVVELNQPIYGTNYRAQDIAVKSDNCTWWQDWYGVNMSHPAGPAYYKSIVDMYASWGADYIKVDCIFSSNMHEADIMAISDSIVESGADILLSLSPGANATVQQAKEINANVNMYRITNDFWDCWSTNHNKSAHDVCVWCSNALSHLESFPMFNGMIGAAGLNGSSWPDGDMLPFGYIMDPASTNPTPRPTRLTQDEQTFVMTLWCINRSPLIFGGDPTKLDDFTTALLTNDEVLDVQKSSNGSMVIPGTGSQYFAQQATGANGLIYVAILNPSNTTIQVSFPYKLVGLSGTCTVRDLWATSNLGSFASSFSFSVNIHGARLFSISGCQ